MTKSKYFNRCNILSFLTAFTTLALQILIYRIISAKLRNNYAFLVISLTMLGFAISGVILAFKKRFIKNFRRNIYRSVYLLVFSLLLSVIVFYFLPIGFQTYLDKPNPVIFIKTFLFCISAGSLFVVPFIFSGLILGLLLSHKQLPTRKIYGFDLIGSAAGAISVIYLISFLGVEKSLIILCGLLLICVNIVFPIRSKFFRYLFLLSLILLLNLFYFYRNIFILRYPVSVISVLKLEPEYCEWDPVTRIEVSEYKVIPENFPYQSCLIGSNPHFHSAIKKILTQNGNAFTYAVHYDGRKDSLKGIEETIYSSAYQASCVPSPNVLVIGVGGGTDVLAGIYFNASKITGIEINGAEHRILKKVYEDYFHHWVNDPRVNLVHDEGRHFLSRAQERFDIIQLTGVDTYTGTMASANIFSENYLYTKEAIGAYFDRLTDQGIMNITRLDFPHMPEMLRMLTTAVFVLREKGIKNPSDHIATVSSRGNDMTALLVKKTPFTGFELRKLEDWTEHNPYLYLSSAKNIRLRNNLYQLFLNLHDEFLEEQFITLFPLNIRPVVDDRPFFFRHTYWKHLLAAPKGIIPLFEYSVLFLLIFVGFLSFVFVYLPLKYLLSPIKPKGIYKYGLVLACIGLGYLMLEIALMQKYGLFLGHPNYAISVILSSLLFSSGLGSLFSKQIISKIKNMKYVAYCFSFIVFIEYIFILPNTHSILGLNVFIKGIITALSVFLIGVLPGVYMPITINRLKMISPQLVSWGWGINGIFSVIAPILAISISVSWGINSLILIAIFFYLVAGFLLSLG